MHLSLKANKTIAIVCCPTKISFSWCSPKYYINTCFKFLETRNSNPTQTELLNQTEGSEEIIAHQKKQRDGNHCVHVINKYSHDFSWNFGINEQKNRWNIGERKYHTYTFRCKEFRKSLNELFCCEPQVILQPIGDLSKAKDPAVPHPEEHSGGSYTGDCHVAPTPPPLTLILRRRHHRTGKWSNVFRLILNV